MAQAQSQELFPFLEHVDISCLGRGWFFRRLPRAAQGFTLEKLPQLDSCCSLSDPKAPLQGIKAVH